jgi:hypothetical protein
MKEIDLLGDKGVGGLRVWSGLIWLRMWSSEHGNEHLGSIKTVIS